MGPREGTGCAARGVRGARLGILPGPELVGIPSLVDLIRGDRRSSALELQAWSLDIGEGGADLPGCQPVQPSHRFHCFPSVSSRTGLVPWADSRVGWPLWVSAVGSWGSRSPRKLLGENFSHPQILHVVFPGDEPSSFSLEETFVSLGALSPRTSKTFLLLLTLCHLS